MHNLIQNRNKGIDFFQSIYDLDNNRQVFRQSQDLCSVNAAGRAEPFQSPDPRKPPVPTNNTFIIIYSSVEKIPNIK